MSLTARSTVQSFMSGLFRRVRHDNPKLGQTSNRSLRGMWAGKDVRTGNATCFSAKKSRRRWEPNAHHKRLWSELLGDHVRLSVTTHALRAVDRAGGIDNYILGTSDAKLNSTQAMAVKERLMKALGEQADSRVADVRDMLRRKSAVKQEES